MLGCLKKIQIETICPEASVDGMNLTAGERLVGVFEEGPVGPAEGECDCGEGEGAVAGDVAVDGLGARRVRHGHEVVDQQLGNDVLEGKKWDIKSFNLIANHVQGDTLCWVKTSR